MDVMMLQKNIIHMIMLKHFQFDKNCQINHYSLIDIKSKCKSKSKLIKLHIVIN